MRTLTHPGARIRLALWIAVLVMTMFTAFLPQQAQAASYSTPTGVALSKRTASSLTLTWKPSPNAPRYRVRYSASPNMANSTYHRTYNPTYKIKTLKPNTTYYTQIRVISLDGTTSLTPYSPIKPFTTAASAPAPSVTPTTATPKPTTSAKPTATPTTPAGSAKPTTSTPTASVKPTTPTPSVTQKVQAPTQVTLVSSSRTALAVEWQPVAGASKYKVTYRKSGASSSASVESTKPRADLLGLASSTSYSIEVQAVGSGGVLSGADKALVASTRSSTHSYLKLSPADFTVVPEPTDPTTAIRFSWDARGNDFYYRVRLSDSASMSNPTYLRMTETSGSIADMTPGATRYAQVAVVSKSWDTISEYSPVRKVTTEKSAGASPTGKNPLRVASYNVTCYSCGNSKTNGRPWADRKDVVAAVIKKQSPDVIGVQEASQGLTLDPATGNKSPQFEQLVAAIGGKYKVTNDQRYNCVKHTSPSSCVYKDRGASQGTRIIYDSSKLKLISQGSTRLSEIVESDNDRYLAWAIFQQLSSGKQFFFANTHLEPTKDADGKSDFFNLRKKQAQEALASIRKNNKSNLPIVLVGDLNSHRWTNPSNIPYEVLLAGGLVDPLGMALDTQFTQPGATVERRINTSFSSYNGYDLVAPRLRYLNGTYLDYILTTPMRMTEYENVVSVNPVTGVFTPVLGGVNVPIPADHNMQRATVHLP